MTIYRNGKEIVREDIETATTKFDDDGYIKLYAAINDTEFMSIEFGRRETMALIRLGARLGLCLTPGPAGYFGEP